MEKLKYLFASFAFAFSLVITGLLSSNTPYSVSMLEGYKVDNLNFDGKTKKRCDKYTVIYLSGIQQNIVVDFLDEEIIQSYNDNDLSMVVKNSGWNFKTTNGSFYYNIEGNKERCL
jgi:hypothetical protein